MAALRTATVKWWKRTLREGIEPFGVEMALTIDGKTVRAPARL